MLDLICDQIADGKSLRSICSQEGMPVKYTVLRWLQADPAFAERYAQARVQAADALAEELQDLADQAIREPEKANAIRVAIDAKKWIASKLRPKAYGDRIEQHVVNEVQSPVEVEAKIKLLEAELLDLMRSHGSEGRADKQGETSEGLTGAQPASVPTTRTADPLH
jgi:hypothetical protein